MSIASIESALIDGFNAGNFGFGNNVIYENYKPANFEEETSTYAELSIVINPYRIATLSTQGSNEFTGFMQVDVYMAPNQGKGPVLQKADEIESYFNTGRTFEYNGQLVTVNSFGIGPSQLNQTHFHTPLTINFTARVRRKG